MFDEHIEAYRKSMDPRWDDLRARRGLRAFRRRMDQRRLHSSLRTRAALLAAPVVLTVVAVAVANFTGIHFGKQQATPGPSDSPAPIASTSQTASPPVGNGFDVATTTVLADGSRLELSQSARVDVLIETSSRVELAQTGGPVRYDVARIPTRVFVVQVADVRVHVTGTIFVVDSDAGKVSVKVQRGRVQVVAPRGEVQLAAGDELSTWSDTLVRPEATVETARTEERGSPRTPQRREAAPAVSPGALLDTADAQRRSGDLASAGATLRAFLRGNQKDPRAQLAWFSLGKVERARDQPSVSATAFRASFAAAPNGALAEDALAEEAAAWEASGNSTEARSAAEQYIRRFPHGAHATRMKRIVE